MHWISMRLKHFKIGIHEICAFCLIIFATVLRIILISQGWPETNSDEGTMGLMALHIAYRHEHPIFSMVRAIWDPLRHTVLRYYFISLAPHCSPCDWGWLSYLPFF